MSPLFANSDRQAPKSSIACKCLHGTWGGEKSTASVVDALTCAFPHSCCASSPHIYGHISCSWRAHKEGQSPSNAPSTYPYLIIHDSNFFRPSPMYPPSLRFNGQWSRLGTVWFWLNDWPGCPTAGPHALCPSFNPFCLVLLPTTSTSVRAATDIYFFNQNYTGYTVPASVFRFLICKFTLSLRRELEAKYPRKMMIREKIAEKKRKRKEKRAKQKRCEPAVTHLGTGISFNHSLRLSSDF